MKRIILLSSIGLFLLGCNKMPSHFKAAAEAEAPTTNTILYDEKNSSNAAGKVMEEKVASAFTEATLERPLPPNSASRVESKIPTQIIRNGTVNFQVENLEKSHAKIEALLKQHSAYFGSDTRTQNNFQIDGNMIIRVPSQNFDKILEALMSESVYTNSKNITAEDVTSQFVDIEARLKTKKEVELRYTALLREAKKVSDILEVENNLRTIREEIESQEGQLKYLKDQVSYSTINLSIYQKLDYSPEPELGFFSKITEAFVNGWRGLISFFVGLVSIWPFAIIFSVIVFYTIKRWRNRKN